MNNLQNKQFVLTGELEQMKREEAEERIRAAGGNISETVTKDTNFLISGITNKTDIVHVFWREATGWSVEGGDTERRESVLAECHAMDFGIPKLDEGEFIKLLEGNWKPPSKILDVIARALTWIFLLVFLFLCLFKNRLAITLYLMFPSQSAQRFIRRIFL